MAWIVSIVIGAFVNYVLFTDLALVNAAAMRPEADITANLPLGFAFMLLGFFAFAYAYAKGYEGGNGVKEGVRFGLVTAVIIIGFGVIWQYVVFLISGAFAAAIVVDTLVEAAIYGAIVGAIYRPTGERRP